jgi:hypothetical protein
MSDGEDYADVDASAASAAGGGGSEPASRARESTGDGFDDIPFDIDFDPPPPPPPPRPVDPRDERVTDDCFAPPKIPCECYCLHCQRTFMSTGIWFQRVKNAQPGHLDGFWLCPTPNCDGKGFTFDIFPTDPDHPANEGWHYDDEDDEAWEDDDDLDEGDASPVAGEADYDPDEAKWKRLDEELGEEADDDIEGEEWKYGLQPGESLPEAEWQMTARREREEEERRYDLPDERPREIEWDEPEPGGVDDIPF